MYISYRIPICEARSFFALQILILYAIELQLAFPSATDPLVPTERGNPTERGAHGNNDSIKSVVSTDDLHSSIPP